MLSGLDTSGPLILLRKNFKRQSQIDDRRSQIDDLRLQIDDLRLQIDDLRLQIDDRKSSYAFFFVINC